MLLLRIKNHYRYPKKVFNSFVVQYYKSMHKSVAWAIYRAWTARTVSDSVIKPNRSYF